jgi:hypothetical protein
MRAERRVRVLAVLCLVKGVACGSNGSRPDAKPPGGVDAHKDAAAGSDAASGSPDVPVEGAADDAASGTDAADATDAISPADAPSDTADRASGDGAVLDGGPCASEMLSVSNSAAYFPLTAGARWVYRGAATNNGVAIGPRLAERQVTDVGTAAVTIHTTGFDLGPTQTDEAWNLTSDGLVLASSGPSSATYADPSLLAAPFLAVPFPIQTCSTFVPYDKGGLSTGHDSDGDGVPETMRVSATSMATFEDVTVPVGSFPKALRIDTVEDRAVTYSMTGSTSHQKASSTSWYGRGAGLIKHWVPVPYDRTHELIGYVVGAARHGVVPAQWLSQTLTEAPTNPYTPNRPAIGFDGHEFLVVAPTSMPSGSFDTGNLQAFVVDQNGAVVSSSQLLDVGSENQTPSIAWDGTRYLVAYHNAGYGRIEMLTVSPTGDTLDGPIVLDNVRATPSVVATGAGFLACYQKGQIQPGTGQTVNNIWVAAVDGHAHPMPGFQPFPTGIHTGCVLARDDGGDVMALTLLPPAMPSATLPDPANILAAARLGADGHAIDTTPFPVDAVAGVGHDSAQLSFDGTNFVALWNHRTSSTVHAHIARISPLGTLLDGPATGGSIDVGANTGGSRIGRLGMGSLLVSPHRLANDFFAQGIGGTRITSDGKPLDVPGDDGGRWFLADYGAGSSSLVEILWGGDRALVVWTNQAGQNGVFTMGDAVAFPW